MTVDTMTKVVETATAQVATTADAQPVAVFGGRLDAFAVAEMRSRLNTCCAGNSRTITADLADADYVDSAALAVLVSTYKRLRAEGGALRVVAPRDAAARRVFELTQFDRVFHMVPAPTTKAG